MELIETVLLPGSLWFIMYSMGLSLTPGDFRRVLLNRGALIVGICSMMIALPLIGVAIAFAAAPSPALAVGFVLLATCPGGMLSNLMTDYAGGDLALSLSLSVIVSLVYLVVIPFYAYGAVSWFMGSSTAIDVPFLESVVRVVSITLVPVSLGIVTRRYRRELAMTVKPYIKNGATLVLVIAFGFIVVDQIETLRRTFGTLLIMVIAMNALALVVASALCALNRLSLFETKAVCIEHMIRQEGTAIYIAVSVIGVREMSLPMIVNTPVGLVFCIVLVVALRLYGARPAAAGSRSAD